MISFNLQFEKEKVKSEVAVMKLNKGDYEGMREELAKIDWKGILAGMMVEQQWQEFLGINRKTQDHLIPKRKKDSKGSRRQPWPSREVRDRIKLKEKMYNTAKSSRKPEDSETFIGQQKETKWAIQAEKMKHEGKLARNVKKDSKGFFRHVKGKRIAKSNVGPLKADTGEIIMGNKEMAEELNRYFGSVFTKEDTNNLPDVMEDRGSKGVEELK
ncbi:uncharacterized protein LOC129693972 [Leucoraja erinacea]|uniref:uncharacterized protein LOC129693972 n=1 Tax=Leucoraja erinaceus TaxID=7782 RepID=UPI002455D313|nr:uncharacterized protein LOC129693972 [Leucoraja erinacea]